MGFSGASPFEYPRIVTPKELYTQLDELFMAHARDTVAVSRRHQSWRVMAGVAVEATDPRLRCSLVVVGRRNEDHLYPYRLAVGRGYTGPTQFEYGPEDGHYLKSGGQPGPEVAEGQYTVAADLLEHMYPHIVLARGAAYYVKNGTIF